MMMGGYHLAGGPSGNANANAAAAAGLLRPGQLTRQGSWSGQASGGLLDGNNSTGHHVDHQTMMYPVRPHTTQPMDTPLARYSSGAGQPMMMMMGQGVGSSSSGHHQHQNNGSGSGIQTNYLYKNQDPFSVDGQTVHMDDLLPQSGSNAFGQAGPGGNNGGRPVGLTRSTSAFGHRMSVAEAFDEEEEEEDEDDRSTASPTDKAGRSGYLHQQPLQHARSNGSQQQQQKHHAHHQQHQQQQPIQLSSSQLALSGGRAVSPTGTMLSRSLTPFSESSYQASIASTKMKKRSLVVPPPPSSTRRTKQPLKNAEPEQEGSSADEEDDEEEVDDDDDEEEEDEDDDDEDEDDERDSVVESNSNRAAARVAQGSPTRRGKGKDAKSVGTLKQAALLSAKNGKATAAAGGTGKKGKTDAKPKEAVRKTSNGAAKTSTSEKDKPYVPEGLPPPPRSAEKPSWSYAALIGQAILSSSRKRLALNQIYAWISAAYPYFKPGESGWMNSIRHNLSLNDCFVKGERNAEEKGGKGSVWMVDPKLEFQFKDGGFKKQQKARQVMSNDSDLGSSATKAKKRKAVGEVEVRRTLSAEMATPIMHATPIMLGQEQYLHGPHGLQCSPLPVDGPLTGNKRPRLEKANTWATPMQPGSRPGSGAGFRRNSAMNGQAGMGEPEEESGLTREQIAKLRRYTGSPIVVNTQTGMLMDRGSPEDTFHHPGMPMSAPPIPMSARLVHSSASSQGKFNADDYTTPNRPHSSNPLHRAHMLSSSMMMPQLTPSASSPVSSSPFPTTVARAHGLDRRMSQMHDGSDSDDAVRIRQDGDALSSDPALPEPHRKPYSMGLQPAPQLDGAFVIPAPPAKSQRPKTSPLETNLTSNTQSGHTLSPIIDRKPQKSAKTVSLPGPGDLLSQSPRLDRSNGSAADVLGHLDRLPRSPIGPSYASSITSDSFATPMGPMSRHRTAGFTPRTNVIGQLTTPSRNAAGIPHETPIGNVKLQFKAEHRLLDSPMGLPGSCYDLANHGYQVDWELEQMTNRGSPTSGGCRRTEGESVARTLFEVESGPFSDP